MSGDATATLVAAIRAEIAWNTNAECTARRQAEETCSTTFSGAALRYIADAHAEAAGRLSAILENVSTAGAPQ